MPTVPSQVSRDLNLNSGDSVELGVACELLRNAETAVLTESVGEVSRAFDINTINRDDGGVPNYGDGPMARAEEKRRQAGKKPLPTGSGHPDGPMNRRRKNQGQYAGKK